MEKKYPEFITARCEQIKMRYDKFKSMLHSNYQILMTCGMQNFEFPKDAAFDEETFVEFLEFLKADQRIDHLVKYGDYNTDPDEMSRPYVKIYISPKNGFIETVITTVTRLKH